MSENKNVTHYSDIPKSEIFTSKPIPIRIRNANEVRKADLEFEGIDHSGQSYEGRVFLNTPQANDSTPLDLEHGYAGSFFIFAHGGRCYGGAGHCTVPSETSIYDLRTNHPLTPGYTLVRVTEQLRRVVSEKAESVTVTVVPIIMSYNKMADPYNLLKFKKLRLIVYDR